MNVSAPAPAALARRPHKLPKANDTCWCGSGKKFNEVPQRRRRGRPAPREEEPRAEPGAGRVSPMRTVPPEIPRPDYAETGDPVRRRQPRVQTPDVIERMRVAGRAAAEVLDSGRAAVAPGVTTDEIDAVVHEAYIDRGGYPSTLNYRGYPKSLCTSVNEVICHGIPDDRPLARRRHRQHRRHDLPRRRARRHQRHLPRRRGRRGLRTAWCDVTRECLDRGIAAVCPAGRSTTSAGPSRSTPTANGYEVVRGLRRPRHRRAVPHRPADPALLRAPAHQRVMEPGMTFTIEPMITMGTGRTTSGTTTGPRSPPTAAAPPSSSTPCSSPTTASRS